MFTFFLISCSWSYSTLGSRSDSCSRYMNMKMDMEMDMGMDTDTQIEIDTNTDVHIDLQRFVCHVSDIGKRFRIVHI
jgi:hypothetical protein